MSVTKWIHLHGGDKTLAAFFQKIREVLVPGGYFVLEPQPWKSYKSAVRKLVRSSLKIHPKMLLDIKQTCRCKTISLYSKFIML